LKVDRNAKGTNPVLSGLMLFDESRHSSALESLSLTGLSGGDAAQAFKFADRRCRISPVAGAHHYTLRGEISYRMGYFEAALQDIERALELAPDDISANRRMLAWGKQPAQIQAAQRLLAIEYDFAGVAAAIAVLQKTGQRAFGAVKWTDTTLTGWALWNRSRHARIAIESGADSRSISLTPDPRHPLATSTANAANFSLNRPHSQTSQLVSLYAAKKLFHEARLRPNVPAPFSHGAGRSGEPASPTIDIIVPVYGDFEATTACFESLMPEIAACPDARLIVVDDASRDPRIKQLADGISKKTRIILLTNEKNLGFAASVNRALEKTQSGDVILLNADTVVPPRFIQRLKSIAHSAPDIGTITPLSNNGEFTSLPVAFRSNLLGTYQDVCDIDAAAARVSAGRVIDIPNGIGFCLYLTRACLDAIGPLSEAYDRGYFEDVELCLRAREFGFRNVCAVSVYVGHAGTRSFGAEKRSLVVRNQKTIERRFPKYESECVAFVKVDPLRPAREAIERSIPSPHTGATLLVTGPGLTEAVVEARAQDLSEQNEFGLIVRSCTIASNPVVSLYDPAKGFPQSLTFKLSEQGEREAALSYLKSLQLARIEIADPAGLTPAFSELLLRLECPIDLLVADAGFVCRRGSFVRLDGTRCDAQRIGRPCDECLAAPIVWAGETTKDWLKPWEGLVARVRHIYAPNHQAKSFASRFVGHRKVIDLKPPKRDLVPARRPKNSKIGRGIGLVVVGSGAAEYRLIKTTALALNHELPERPVIVIGQTLDDLGLMRLDNVHVTGAVDRREYSRILSQYDIGALFFPIRQPLFGHPTMAGLAERVATASFDWSSGEGSPRAGDLALRPGITNDELIESLVSWLSEI
jgi:O-antigen biosynthesis protein